MYKFHYAYSAQRCNFLQLLKHTQMQEIRTDRFVTTPQTRLGSFKDKAATRKKVDLHR